MQPLHGWVDSVEQEFALSLHGQPHCNVAQLDDIMRMRWHVTALSAPGIIARGMCHAIHDSFNHPCMTARNVHDCHGHAARIGLRNERSCQIAAGHTFHKLRAAPRD